MTDWPDEWFRGGAQQAGANRSGDERAPATAAAGGAAPVGDAVAVGGAAAAAALPPGGAAPGSGDPTVQLPVRPAAGAPPGGPGGPGGPGAPGGGGWPAQPATRTANAFRLGSPHVGWRRWLRPRPILAIVAVLASLALIAAIGGYFYLDSQLTRVNALVSSPATAGQNWLITGSTGHLTKHQIVRYRAGFNFDTLSDTILVLHIPDGGRPTLVSIPRDSYVAIPGHGMNKINAAYAFGGPTLLVRTVQNATGLHIDHFVQIGYAGLVNVVDAIGGVRVCLPGPVIDPKAGIHLHKGCQNLDGKQALGFVRTRRFALGDLQRVQDQRILIKAMLSKMTSFGTLINPFAIFPAASGSVHAIEVDQGTSLYQLIHLAFALKNPVTTTVPFGGFANNAAGAVVLWNAARAHQMFYDLAHDKPLPKSLITGSKISGTA
jgi:LCP family protein required for cell wall assembly